MEMQGRHSHLVGLMRLYITSSLFARSAARLASEKMQAERNWQRARERMVEGRPNGSLDGMLSDR